MHVTYPPPNLEAYTRTPSHNHSCSAVGAQIMSRSLGRMILGRMILSCQNYLHADVSDGKDLSHHQQEVTGGPLVMMSLVPGTVDSDVTSGKVSSWDSS